MEFGPPEHDPEMVPFEKGFEQLLASAIIGKKSAITHEIEMERDLLFQSILGKVGRVTHSSGDQAAMLDEVESSTYEELKAKYLSQTPVRKSETETESEEPAEYVDATN